MRRRRRLPKYDYHCDKCRRTIERYIPLAEFEDRDNQDCPDCGGRLDRINHYGSLHIAIPEYMRADGEHLKIPDDEYKAGLDSGLVPLSEVM
jgi:putative FmdB family regulatory protein